MSKSLVVVGGGQAAAHVIEAARQEGFGGPITLITEEPVLPYQRPPLSKSYLSGTHTPEWLLYRGESFYRDNNIAALLGARAEEIDRTGRSVRLADGRAVAYDMLALTTGARARRLEVPGAESPCLAYIRTLGDVSALLPKLGGARRIVIVGGGFIGLEAAAALVRTGREVTLLAQQDRLIPRVVCSQISSFLLSYHTRNGVRIVAQESVTEIADGPSGCVVKCRSGTTYPADLVIAGVGALPNTELAAAAGLVCENGIVVDEQCVTSDPAIVSAGDCTNHPNPLSGRRLRLETVHNAVEQGRSAGFTVAGKRLPYVQSPWVWSDQYDLRLQSVGLFEGYDQSVLRGDPSGGRFSIFYFSGDTLLSATSVNQPHVFMAARRLLNTQVPLSPQQAADSAFDLAALVPRDTILKFDQPWVIRRRGLSADAWGHA